MVIGKPLDQIKHCPLWTRAQAGCGNGYREWQMAAKLDHFDDCGWFGLAAVRPGDCPEQGNGIVRGQRVQRQHFRTVQPGQSAPAGNHDGAAG
ncbi:hypothetical protein GCM10027610_083580 [Dactylosporangium cerinum]